MRLHHQTSRYQSIDDKVPALVQELAKRLSLARNLKVVEHGPAQNDCDVQSKPTMHEAIPNTLQNFPLLRSSGLVEPTLRVGGELVLPGEILDVGLPGFVTRVYRTEGQPMNSGGRQIDGTNER